MRGQIGSRLVIATHNKGKLEEISGLLRPYGVEVISASAYGLPEPEETESTFVGNARIKAHAAAKTTGLTALSDDSGICVDALGGAPGVYTADWAETEAGRDFNMAMARTWEACEAIRAPHPRSAQFCCTLVLAFPDGRDIVFEGSVSGTLVWPMRGGHGHGYDPMFQPDGYRVTFAEMDIQEKGRISHRADAFRKFVAACFT
ncbi:RdgB/HAM1 family non-canonical purine NTP pyrophosphatase [Pseudotabrizicola alkalilacus]|uniref:dITP/XTP pyrophosphatase n=1 Tax=Pseudotabrizicola alkalilacus TaxID=2305252 RepID=A0A411YY84_9RHOB|nr:RdgB/HAM1 family non-canonical purine NTP pyrophosphatase [Pseudotabrizicola alkalilacus]RGP35857.1 RdgB/HAM1 family non-canonical purine NTP pyrophosphatase [Pseudotabrizicola alkalilacus]